MILSQAPSLPMPRLAERLTLPAEVRRRSRTGWDAEGLYSASSFTSPPPPLFVLDVTFPSPLSTRPNVEAENTLKFKPQTPPLDLDIDSGRPL